MFTSSNIPGSKTFWWLIGYPLRLTVGIHHAPSPPPHLWAIAQCLLPLFRPEDDASWAALILSRSLKEVLALHGWDKTQRRLKGDPKMNLNNKEKEKGKENLSCETGVVQKYSEEMQREITSFGLQVDGWKILRGYNRLLHRKLGDCFKELNYGFYTQRKVAPKMQMAASSWGWIQTLHFPVILAITFN